MAGIFITAREGDGLGRSLGHVFGRDRVVRSGGSASVLVVPIGAEGLDDGAQEEIAEALRLGKKIVPVLVDDAVMPGESELPSEIAGFARLRYRRLGGRTAEQDTAGLVIELIRIAPELGIGVVQGLEDLGEWLESWRNETLPVLPEALPVLGRARETDRLCGWLDAAPSVLPVYAVSRTEAAAFVATAVAAQRPGLRAVRVSSEQGWRHCRDLEGPFVAVVDGVEVGEDTGGGHVVVVRRTPDRDGADLLELPGIPRDEAAEEFAAAGVPPADATAYADIARLSLGALRRKLAVADDLPKWVNPLERDLAAPLLLIGRWSAGSRHDLDEIAAIAGREIDELTRFFARSEAGDDPLLARSGDTVRLADPHDAWALLHGRLGAQDLRRWHEEAVKVLTEREPGRKWSVELRHGLARSAALLASEGDTTLSGGVACADHATRFVREVLGQANDDADGVLWRSLADVLPLLAEAAPHEFLGAVDHALTSDPSPLSGTSDGLIAALETVSRSDDALPMVVSLLAELTRPGRETGDQPLESLITLVQPWYPYLDLPAGQRTELVKAIGRRSPEAGWRLALALLRGPRGHLLATPKRPQVRLEWTVPAPPVAVVDGPEFEDELVASALSALAERPHRWCEFFERLPELNTAQWDRVVEAFTRLDAERLSADERLRLWGLLTGVIAEHRHHDGASWTLPEELLQWLESCAEMVEPAVNPGRHGLLFGRAPYLDGGDSLDPDARDAEIGRLRRDAVGGVLREHGAAGLSALAAESALPRLVGVVAAQVAGDDLQEDALAELGREDWAAGWAGEMARSQGDEWRHGVATQLKEQDRLVDYLLAVPVDHAPSLFEAADDAVLEGYWTHVGPWPLPEGRESFFVTQLARRRPWAAVKALALAVRAAEPPSLPLALVEDVLLQASADGVEAPDRKAVANVGPLLDHLAEAGASDVAVARLELRFHAALKHHRKPRSLQRILAEDPGAFVDLCTRIQPVDDGAPSVELVDAWLTIFETRTMPGATESGLDGAALKAWVSRARAEFAERGRAEFGDRAIGTLLASGSPVPDGGWPPEPVRDVLDVADGGYLREGFATGLTVQDGDSGELAQRHRGWARRINVGWPRVAALLREHADDLARRG
ncbi:hypothetical protein SAMN04489729_1696 [Amycolatopsis lurida]|uniref:Uncharacterized protein n=1 Tax=Amycolatopsis lurida NRRL 2430 TaxID=1460371 RepID=A0A2P2FGV5_AMYLU|nr:hypothetical protein [Amycolatopsis lurida]KFU75958.1 hypothetical protein BB31_38855 [Amycolatopsis lurida NRRL 2430]SEC48806.1 hypothetical protein SAMN04489729_1696 [Amycolatopsis lurida]